MDDDEINNKEKDEILKNQRCQCCKMRGHSMEECFRDPNMKTQEDNEEEFERVTQLKDFRKMFPDS